MKAERIMFLVHLETYGDVVRWNWLLCEHPNWEDALGKTYKPKTIIIPNMTFECAEIVDKWLEEKRLKRTWLKDNEPEYYEVLRQLEAES